MAHEQFKSCIEVCNECTQACDHCAVACLSEPNVNELERCIRLDMDCAQICLLAISYMSRGSEMVPDVCAICAEICEACAEECEKYDMLHCKECAEACRRCADECRTMASSGMSQEKMTSSGAAQYTGLGA